MKNMKNNKSNEIYNKIEKLETSIEDIENKKMLENNWIDDEEYFEDEDYFDDDEYYDEEDYFEDDEYIGEDNLLEDIDLLNHIMEENEEKELKKELAQAKKEINDKIQKNKTFEQYLSEKTKEELTAITSMYYKKSEGEKVKEDIKSILKNRKELFKASLETCTTEQIETLEEALKKGYKEIKIRSIQELDKTLNNCIPLKMFGIIFAKVQGKKVIIHIPEENIKIIKEILNDKEFIETNTEYNKTYNLIRGALNTYGVIEMSKLNELHEKYFSKSSKALSEKLILYLMHYQDAGILMDKQNEENVYLYNEMLEEKEAEQIIEKTAKLDYCEYDLNEYSKIANLSEYIKQTKTYQKMKNALKQKEMWNIEEVRNTLDEVIPQYAILKRINGAEKDAKELLDMVCMSFDILDSFSDELGQTMRKFITEIAKEFPEWNKKGKKCH